MKIHVHVYRSHKNTSLVHVVIRGCGCAIDKGRGGANLCPMRFVPNIMHI